MVFEFGAVILAIIIMSMAPSTREEGMFLTITTILFLATMLHLLIIPFKGLNFIIQDEDPSSIWKYYWLIVIFLATFHASTFEKYFVNLAIFIESSVISPLEFA